MGQSTEPPLEQVRAEVARLRLERDALRGQISYMQEITDSPGCSGNIPSR